MRTEGMARSPCSGVLSVRTARTGWRGQAHASHGTRIGLHQGQQAPSSPGTPQHLPVPGSGDPLGSSPVLPAHPQSHRHLHPKAGGAQCPPPPAPHGSVAFYFAEASLATLLPGVVPGEQADNQRPPPMPPVPPMRGHGAPHGPCPAVGPHSHMQGPCPCPPPQSLCPLGPSAHPPAPQLRPGAVQLRINSSVQRAGSTHSER